MHYSCCVLLLASTASAFAPLGHYAVNSARPTTPALRDAVVVQMGRGNLRDEKESKRQSRVSQLMRGEIAQFIRLGSSIKTRDPLPDTLRERISIVDVHMSPDLRSAKVRQSITKKKQKTTMLMFVIIAYANDTVSVRIHCICI